MNKLALYSLTLLSVLAIAAPLSADEIGLGVVFSDREISIIQAYYRDHAPAGKNKQKDKKGLPPGIARNLARGKSLPPGIAKQTLPAGLVDLLPPPPRGYERVVVSGKVLLVEIATQAIHDVLEDVILGK